MRQLRANFSTKKFLLAPCASCPKIMGNSLWGVTVTLGGTEKIFMASSEAFLGLSNYSSLSLSWGWLSCWHFETQMGCLEMLLVPKISLCGNRRCRGKNSSSNCVFGLGWGLLPKSSDGETTRHLESKETRNLLEIKLANLGLWELKPRKSQVCQIKKS